MPSSTTTSNKPKTAKAAKPAAKKPAKPTPEKVDSRVDYTQKRVRELERRLDYAIQVLSAALGGVVLDPDEADRIQKEANDRIIANSEEQPDPVHWTEASKPKHWTEP